MSQPVTTSERLWSEEVGIADAHTAPVADIAYRFSSGRTFAALQYAPPGPDAPPAWTEGT